jgi:hypothetical protein
MPDRNARALMLDHKHCRAICDEVGDRLRYALNQETPEIPPRLLALIDQLARLENDDPVRLRPSPSIAPSIDEMTSGLLQTERADWPTDP